MRGSHRDATNGSAPAWGDVAHYESYNRHTARAYDATLHAYGVRTSDLVEWSPAVTKTHTPRMPPRHPPRIGTRHERPRRFFSRDRDAAQGRSILRWAMIFVLVLMLAALGALLAIYQMPPLLD